jgi:hypothetical protein
MKVHPAPAIELVLIAASAGFLLSDSASNHAIGIRLLWAALIFAIGVALIYDRPPLMRH